MNFLNPVILKKWTAMLLCGFLPVIAYTIGIRYYNFWMALLFFGCALLISVILGNLLLKNEFTAILEGAGLLCLNIDSTGVIRPFIMNVTAPYITGILNKTRVTDVYDREAVLQLATPANVGRMHKITKADGVGTEGDLLIVLSEAEYNKCRFGFMQYPVLIYNAQIDSLLTKDFLSEQEKKAFAEHGVLYLNRKMEELTSSIRDFGRYIVEQLKPSSGGGLLSNWLFWVIIGLIIILLLLFGKPLYNSIMGMGGEAASAVSTATAGAATAPVTPRV